MSELLTREDEISCGHGDCRGMVRPSFLFRVMQDMATLHAAELHLGTSDLNLIWVLSRMKVTLSRPLLPYERVRCETWCPGTRGATWYRNFAFFAADEPVGEALSMWVTLDPATHRILRPTALPAAAAFLHTDRNELPPALPKLGCETVRPHHVHPVRYSDLDSNRHLNNATVVDLVADALDLQKQPGFVSEMQVNYTAETSFGENVSLLAGTSGASRYVRGEVDGQTHFEALATLAPLPHQGGDAL